MNRAMSLSFLACFHVVWAVRTEIHLGGQILFHIKLMTDLLNSHRVKTSQDLHLDHELSSYKVFQKAVKKPKGYLSPP